MKFLRLFLFVSCVLSLAACSKRLTGTYETVAPSAAMMPLMPTFPGMTKEQQRKMQKQMDDSMRSSFASSKIRLAFEGSKVRMGSAMGIETISPYRIKGDRLEIVLAHGGAESLMVMQIKEDGSLEGMMGRMVKID